MNTTTTKPFHTQAVIMQLNATLKNDPAAKAFSHNFQKMLEAAQEGDRAAVSRFKQAAIVCHLFMLTSRLRIHCNGDVILEKMALFEMCLKAGTVKELYRRRLIDRGEMEAALLRITKSYGKEISYEERSGILQSEYGER